MSDTHKHIFFFRHGETDWNKTSRFQGQTDIPLNSNGIAQAEGLAQELKDHDIGHFFASDLGRAHNTAKIVAEHHDADIVTHPALREVTFGEGEGMHKSEFRVKYKHIMDVMDDLEHPEHRHISTPGGETRQEVIDRVHSYLHVELPKISAQKIGIATHGALMTNIYLDLFKRRYHFGNCEILHLYYDEKNKVFLQSPLTKIVD